VPSWGCSCDKVTGLLMWLKGCDVISGVPSKGSRILVLKGDPDSRGCDLTQSVTGASWSGAILMGPEELGAPTDHVMTGAPAT
jgi:hypothetical protein